jgi:hypothetical protein
LYLTTMESIRTFREYYRLIEGIWSDKGVRCNGPVRDLTIRYFKFSCWKTFPFDYFLFLPKCLQ